MKFHNAKQKLIYKEKIAEQTYILKYNIAPDLEWEPGKYIGVGISGLYRRSYTIWDLTDGVLTLLVDTKPGGLASQFFDRVEVGEESLIIGPYGRFLLQDTPFRKVFISTGTGIAPFYPMVKSLKKGTKATFVFGAGTFNTEIAYQFFQEFISDDFEYVQAITRHTQEHVPVDQDKRVKVMFGRVTTVVPQLNLDYKNCEFYICGSPQMVENMGEVLTANGADKIFYEKYSA